MSAESKARSITVDGQPAYLFGCPHCGAETTVLSSERNCDTYRHAILRTGEPVNPHSSKDDIDRLRASGSIYGCGGPFKLSGSGDNTAAVICGYI
jgi:hypothetical protein